MTSPPYWKLRDYQVEGQIGMEDTIYEYVDTVVSVCREIRRVLRPDGVLWLNIGDTYDTDGTGLQLGKKQKGLVPDRVRIGLQEDGWIIRNDVTWSKPNPMPESVKDRLSEVTESVVFATKNPDYYFDLDSIREPYSESTKSRISQNDGNPKWDGDNSRGHPTSDETIDPDDFTHEKGKNPGDCWEVTTKPYPDAHFAAYPPELCAKPIRASTPPEGVVLDPFAGTGTTLKAADDLGRRWIGVDINPEYVEMADERMGVTKAEHRPATDW
jgi:DNA modification methylase